MHEMSIAIELLGQIEAVAAQHGLERVDEVRIQAGEMRGVVPEALDIAFESAAAGTVAEGAEIRLEIVSARARCRLCSREFQPRIDDFLCPDCRQANVELISGNDVILTSLTSNETEGATTDEED
jgi:hydrogenase nickel incorporation protein HypA/HybF